MSPEPSVREAALIEVIEAGVAMRRAQSRDFIQRSRATHDEKKAAEFRFDRLARAVLAPVAAGSAE